MPPTATGGRHCRGKTLSMWDTQIECKGVEQESTAQHSLHRSQSRVIRLPTHTTTRTHLHHSLSRLLLTKSHTDPPAVDQQDRTYAHTSTAKLVWSLDQLLIIAWGAERNNNKLALAARLQQSTRYPATTKATMQQLLQCTLTRAPYSVHTREATKCFAQWE